jgi:hypothetical protein
LNIENKRGLIKKKIWRDTTILLLEMAFSEKISGVSDV